MPKEKLTERISYRIGGEELRQIQRVAAGKMSPDDWCRAAVREKLAWLRAQGAPKPQPQIQPAAPPAAPSQPPGQVLSRGEMILFEELVRLRWMVETGMQIHLRGGGVSIDHWNYMIEQVNKIGAGKAKEMVEGWLVKYGVKPKS